MDTLSNVAEIARSASATGGAAVRKALSSFGKLPMTCFVTRWKSGIGLKHPTLNIQHPMPVIPNQK
jgi:hypothetical protein